MLFRLNITDHLAETKKLYQVGYFHLMEWQEICNLFISYFRNNFMEIKDTAGFSFGAFKLHDYKSWRLKLYTEYLNIDEALAREGISEEKRNKLHFKWDKINTEQKRLSVLNDLFPKGIESGFHRKADECLSKSAIIIDYDNNSTCYGINSKTGAREAFKHGLSPISYQTVLNQIIKLNVNFILYNSFSDDPEKGIEKFRLILPLDEAIKYQELPAIKEIIINLLSNYKHKDDFIFNLIDYTSFEMPRMFYMPINHISKYDPSNYKQTNYSASYPKCKIDFRYDLNYLSKKFLYEYRNKKRYSLGDSFYWYSIDKIEELRKNIKF